MLEVTTRFWNFELKALKGLMYHYNSISWNCDCQHSLRRWINLEETDKVSKT